MINGIYLEEIGVVTKGDRVRYFIHGELVADVPCVDLVLGGGNLYIIENGQNHVLQRMEKV